MDEILNVKLPELKQTHLQVIPLSVHCGSSCNVVVWKSTNPTFNDDELSDIRISIARLMDRLSDLLRGYQLFAPLVALVKVEAPSSWGQLTGDQDWHRGRFVVQCIAEGDKGAFERAMDRWQGALRSYSYVPQRLTSEDFRKIIEESSKTVKSPRGVDPQLFRRYAENLRSSLGDGEPSRMADKWRVELLDDVTNLLGKSIIDD